MSIETIFDTQVLEQGKRDELITVSSIAQKFLNYKGGKKEKKKKKKWIPFLQLSKSKLILILDDGNIIPSSPCPLMIHTDRCLQLFLNNFL